MAAPAAGAALPAGAVDPRSFAQILADLIQVCATRYTQTGLCLLQRARVHARVAALARLLPTCKQSPRVTRAKLLAVLAWAQSGVALMNAFSTDDDVLQRFLLHAVDHAAEYAACETGMHAALAPLPAAWRFVAPAGEPAMGDAAKADLKSILDRTDIILQAAQNRILRLPNGQHDFDTIRRHLREAKNSAAGLLCTYEPLVIQKLQALKDPHPNDLRDPNAGDDHECEMIRRCWQEVKQDARFREQAAADANVEPRGPAFRTAAARWAFISIRELWAVVVHPQILLLLLCCTAAWRLRLRDDVSAALWFQEIAKTEHEQLCFTLLLGVWLHLLLHGSWGILLLVKHVFFSSYTWLYNACWGLLWFQVRMQLSFVTGILAALLGALIGLVLEVRVDRSDRRLIISAISFLLPWVELSDVGTLVRHVSYCASSYIQSLAALLSNPVESLSLTWEMLVSTLDHVMSISAASLGATAAAAASTGPADDPHASVSAVLDWTCLVLTVLPPVGLVHCLYSATHVTEKSYTSPHGRYEWSQRPHPRLSGRYLMWHLLMVLAVCLSLGSSPAPAVEVPIGTATPPLTTSPCTLQATPMTPWSSPQVLLPAAFYDRVQKVFGHRYTVHDYFASSPLTSLTMDERGQISSNTACASHATAADAVDPPAAPLPSPAPSLFAQPPVLIDWVADVGDGLNATLLVATLLAQPTLRLRNHSVHRAHAVVFGGDLVYPVPTKKALQLQFVDVYNCALSPSVPPSGSAATDQRPVALLIAGNHDHLDGAEAFDELLMQSQEGCASGNQSTAGTDEANLYLKGWRVPQLRRYWAMHVPHARMWLFGLDDQVALDKKVSIDAAQLTYFLERVERASSAGEKIILMQHSPWFLIRTPMHFTMRRLIRAMVAKDVLRLIVTGDMHYYARYDPVPSSNITLLVSGGGGAFLHPTRPLPPRVTSGLLDGNFTFHESFPRRRTLRLFAPWRSWQVERGASWLFCFLVIMGVFVFTHYKKVALFSLVVITCLWMSLALRPGFVPFWISLLPILCSFAIEFLPIGVLMLSLLVKLAAVTAEHPLHGRADARDGKYGTALDQVVIEPHRDIIEVFMCERAEHELPTFDSTEPTLQDFKQPLLNFMALQMSSLVRIRYQFAASQLSGKEFMSQWCAVMQQLFSWFLTEFRLLCMFLFARTCMRTLRRQWWYWWRFCSWPIPALMDMMWYRAYQQWLTLRSLNKSGPIVTIIPPADRHTLTRMFYRVTQVIIGAYAVHLLIQSLLLPLGLVLLTRTDEPAWASCVDRWLEWGPLVDGLFSFAGIADYKHFLRMSLTNASITVHPVLVPHLPPDFNSYHHARDELGNQYLTTHNISGLLRAGEPIHITW